MTRYIFFLSAMLLLCSCGEGCGVKKEDVLVKVGSSVLTKDEMRKQMPFGLSEVDSVKFTRAYIRSWIDDKLVSELASKNIGNTAAIDRMVEEYRKELIMWEYRKRMYETHADDVFTEDSLSIYYEVHKNEYRLDRPIVKGIYIKIADNAPRLADVKKWYRSRKAEDIDNLEKYGITGAIHYDYFRDRWVDWLQIESRIPYNFGSDVDAFIKNNRNFEVSVDGSTYLLDITEYLPTGAVMPFEFAREIIKEQFANRHRIEYDHELRRSLYERGVDDGVVEIYVDLES